MIAHSSYQDFLGELGGLQFSPEADARCQWLMERNNLGEITADERKELEGLVELSEWISLVRARALLMLGRSPVARAT